MMHEDGTNSPHEYSGKGDEVAKHVSSTTQNV